MSTNQPMLLNCPACGAPLDYDGASSVIRCKFCGNRSLVQGAAPGQAAAPAGGLDEIKRLVSAGNIEEAVNRFKAIYQVDDEEARQAIGAIQGGWTATTVTVNGRSPEELTQAMQKIQGLLASGDKLGAIKVYRATFDSSLEKAKAAVELIQNGQMGRGSSGFDDSGSSQVPAALQSTKKNGCGVIAIVITILLITGGLAAFLLLRGSGALAKHYNPGDPVVFVSSGVDGSFALASSLYDSDSDTRFVGLIDPATGKLLWQGAAFKGDHSADAIVGSGDMLYAASDSDLLAYHKSDGSLAWQTVMPDRLAYGKTTLLVTGGRVISANADDSIQAYDANSGRLVWNRQLGGNDRELRLIDNQLVEMDITDTANDKAGIDFIDPVSGAIKSTFTPTCMNDTMKYDLDAQGQFIAIPGEQALLMILSQGCVEKLDLSTMQVTWASTYKDWFSSASDGLPTLFSSGTLYFGNDGDLVTVNLSSGEMKTLVSDKTHDLVPLTRLGDTLIVRARRTTGTERFEIWGVAAGSGAQTWQMTETDSEPIDPPDALAGLIDKTDFGWTWVKTANGFTLLTFKGEPDAVVVETFDPTTGNSQGQKTLALDKIFGDFYSAPTVIGSQGGLLYVNADGTIYALDLTNGTAKFIY